MLILHPSDFGLDGTTALVPAQAEVEDEDTQSQEPNCAEQHQPEGGPGKVLYEPGGDRPHEGRRHNQEQNYLGGLVEERDGVNSKGDDGVDGHAGEYATGSKPE